MTSITHAGLRASALAIMVALGGCAGIGTGLGFSDTAYPVAGLSAQQRPMAPVSDTTFCGNVTPVNVAAACD